MVEGEFGDAVESPSVPDDEEEDDELAGVDAIAAIQVVAVQIDRVQSFRDVVSTGRQVDADHARAPIPFPIVDFHEKL